MTFNYLIKFYFLDKENLNTKREASITKKANKEKEKESLPTSKKIKFRKLTKSIKNTEKSEFNKFANCQTNEKEKTKSKEKEKSKERKLSNAITEDGKSLKKIQKFSINSTKADKNFNRKNSKLIRMKIKKIKKRSHKRDSNLYDINNFVVQNNSNKINEKKDFINIPIPVFRELEDNFYTLDEPEEINNLPLNSDSNILNTVIKHKTKKFIFFII